VYVVATAGHVDHGKSTLVRALTGMEPDRWEAERRRGLTIDLGFAWMTLPSGEQLAFVDVPGHERFVSNMLAGVGPAPAVLFVVAADEGWMPQSREHLAAIHALGVRHGVLVATRADLADPAPALRQAARQTAATSLGQMEAVAVSAVTGRGIPELVAALGRLTARLPAPDPEGPVRLWLDRVFGVKGSGTVVTGTLQAGTVRVGDELTATPSMRPVRVRGIQSLGEPVTQVSGVARVALNLRGVAAAELTRGMALIHASRWTMASVVDVRLAPGPSAGPEPGESVPRWPAQLTVHIGSARTIARVRILGSDVARLTLRDPVPLHVGDCLLLRDPGAATDHASGAPVFGASVLDVIPPRLRGRGTAAAAGRELASWPPQPSAPELLRRHRFLQAPAASAMGLDGLPPPVAGDWLADPEHWQRLRRLLSEAVAAHAERDPLAPGLPVDAARAELGLPDRRMVAALAATEDGTSGPVGISGGYLRCGGSDVRRQEAPHGSAPEQPLAPGSSPAAPSTPAVGGSTAAPRPSAPGSSPAAPSTPAVGGSTAAPRPSAPGRSGAVPHPAPGNPAAPHLPPPPQLPPQVAAAVRALLDDLAGDPFRAPEADRLRELGLDVRALAAAERAGLLWRLPGNVILAAGAARDAARALARLPEPFTAADARHALHTTRRVVIPLLEWLDRAGVTRRLPDDRRVMRGQQS
jgi:selenocysteine-specific elongation factor